MSYRAVPMLAVMALACCWRLLDETLKRRLDNKIAAGSLVSFIHSVLIVVLTLLTDGLDSTCLLHTSEDENSFSQDLIVALSLSYFLHDTFKSGWVGWRLAMLLHHIGGIVFLSLPVLTGRYAPSTVQVLLYLEASNPCFHGRRIITFYGGRGRIFFLVEFLYVTTFAYFRFVRGLVLTIDLIVNRDYLSPYYVVGGVFFQTVSVIFMAYILLHILNKYIHPSVRQLSNFIADKLFEEVKQR